MVQFLTDLLLTAEALVKKRIAFDLEVWNLYRDLTSRTEVRASVNRCGGAGRKSVVIDLVAGKDGTA
jgi:hypothetical protein